MQTLAERFAHYAATLRFEDIPVEVVERVKCIVVDTLGCAFGGYTSQPASIARDLAGLISSTVCATVLGSGHKTSMDLAAFANDVMARYLDFNDGYTSKGGGHASDSIPALIAAAEGAHADGRTLIVAILVAYEVYCRISDAWDNKVNGIDHSTVGGIASVVGVARLLGLNEAQTVQAINLMVGSNVTLGQTRIGNLSMWKGCAYANGNRNALFAAQLAQLGMTGPQPIFEGKRGFFAVVSRELLEIGAFGGTTEAFRIMRCHLKQFPLGNFAQSVVTAVIEARKTISNVNDVERMRIAVSQKALGIMADGPDKWRPANRETADHSIPYTAAVALQYGAVHHGHFDDTYLQDVQLLSLVSRIECHASEEATRRSSELNLCEVELIMRTGERKTVRVEYHRGHPLNPMSRPEIEAKFRSLAAPLLTATQIDGLLGSLWNLEAESNLTRIMEMTHIQ